MFVSLWSTKGGQGVTCAAAMMAVGTSALAGQTTLVDLDGDQPCVFNKGSGTGIAEWSATSGPGGAVRPHVLGAELVNDALVLVRRGYGPFDPSRAGELVEWLKDRSKVVVDAGVLNPHAGEDTGDFELRRRVVEASDQSLLVTKPCYLALRRLAASPVRPTGVVLVADQDRALLPSDVERVAGAPVVATIPADHNIAIALDAGRIADRRWMAPFEHLTAVAAGPAGVQRFDGAARVGPAQWCPWWDDADRRRFLAAASWAVTLRHADNEIDEQHGEAHLRCHGVLADLAAAAQACKDIDPAEWRWYLHQNLDVLMDEGSDLAGAARVDLADPDYTAYIDDDRHTAAPAAEPAAMASAGADVGL